MPVDDLPTFPTPQQAAYVVDTHPKKTSKPPSNNYRPPVKSSSSYQQQGYSPQQQVYQNGHSLSHYQHSQYGAPPQPQQYYPQAPPQPPVQHYQDPPQQQQHHQQPPPQQYAPPPQQQYYQPQPVHHQTQPQVYQPPPQQQTHHQQPPQHQQHMYSQDYNQEYGQNQNQSQSQKYSSLGTSSANTPSSVHKRPPPVNSNSSRIVEKSNRSRESVATEGTAKTSKQKLENELRSVFEKVDTNRSGRISAKELSLALLNFDNTRFQSSTVMLMIKLFSNPDSPSKSLNFDQFVSLWKYLSAYKKLFIQADTNKSGDISFGEFQKILLEIGYKLEIDVVLHLFSRFSYKEGNYDNGTGVGKLKFDAFIELLVYLKKLTDVFKRYDKNLSGEATISFSNFLFEVSNLS